MVNSDKPFDYSSQKWIGIGDKFPKKIHNATTTSDGLMSAEDKAKLDSINLLDYDRIYDIASWDSDGLMSKEDKKKMDSIEDNANNYIHPNTPQIRHVTDEQITYWNAKASTSIVTQTTNGLMSKEDKTKLDNIEANANNYIHPNTPDMRHVTDEQITYWNNKASVTHATTGSDGLMSAADKIKLDSIEVNANNYVHPDNEGVRHVTDAEKDYWNSKASKRVATNSEDGLMASIDKIKLDGIEEGANNYVHPTGSDYNHVTDEQIRYWNSKVGTAIATQLSNGLMSKEDKIKLDILSSIDPNMEDKHFVTSEEKEKWNRIETIGLVTEDIDGLMSKEDKKKLNNIEDNANNYIHPDNENTRHVTDAQIMLWNNKASTDLVTYTTPGLMIAYDKLKLDNIEEAANNYIHPNTPDMRHVTDTQISNWDAKAEKTVVTQIHNGLMSSTDKTKLDTIEYNANNYIHPETHPATMIVEDETHRFITDEEKEKWNRIDTIDLVTHENDGLMSKEDKIKLDEIIKPFTYELSLVYSEWSDTEPYTQTLYVPGISPGINAYIGINPSATIEQMTCAAEANLAVNEVRQDEIEIIANGKKPDMNIPVVIMAGNSILIFEVKQFNSREEYAYEPPTTGTHYQNEIIYSFKPVQTECIGWVCTETGEPGTWLPFGSIGSENDSNQDSDLDFEVTDLDSLIKKLNILESRQNNIIEKLDDTVSYKDSLLFLFDGEE